MTTIPSWLPRPLIPGEALGHAQDIAYMHEQLAAWESSLRDTVEVLGSCGVAVEIRNHRVTLIDADGTPISETRTPTLAPALVQRCQDSRTLRLALTASVRAPYGHRACPNCAGPAAHDRSDLECLRCVVTKWRRSVLRLNPWDQPQRRPRKWSREPSHERGDIP